MTGHQSLGLLAARDRLTESVNWDTVAFLLEGGIFLLMGLQLKILLKQDPQAGLNPVQALWIGLAAAAAAVLLRMMFVAALRRDAFRGASANPQLEQMHSQITAVGSPTSTSSWPRTSAGAAGSCWPGPGCAVWSRPRSRCPTARRRLR